VTHDKHLAAEANHVGCQSEEVDTRRHLVGEVNQVTGQTGHKQHLAEEANAQAPKQVMQKY